MGLNIRIEASHHPSSSLVHPADRLKDLKPQTGESRKLGLLHGPSSQIWDLEDANLILMGVFFSQGFVTLAFLIM